MTGPPTLLVDELAAWRELRNASFDFAWPHVTKAVLASCNDQEFWRLVFAEQREAWRRAYEREAMTGAEFALVGIRDSLPLNDVDRRCEREGCDETVPRTDRKGGVPRRYCSETCRRKAAREVERRRIADDREVPGATAKGTSRGRSMLSEPPILTLRSPR